MQETSLTTNRNILEIEHSIRANLLMSTQGVIGAGFDLIEAKEMLPHGTFDEWIRIKFGLSHRTANNFMRIAREVNPESRVAQLQYTKVLALLDVPADQREQAVEDLNADQASVNELKAAIADLKAANAAKKAAEDRAERSEKMLDQMNEKFTDLSNQLKAEQQKEPAIVKVPVDPDDYDEVKAKAASADALRKRAEQAERYAMQQEEIAQKAKAEARQLMAQQLEQGAALESDPYSPEKMAEAVRAFMGAMGTVPNLKAYFDGMTLDRLQMYRVHISTMKAWVEGAEQAISGGKIIIDAAIV